MNGETVFYLKYALTILGIVIAIGRLFYLIHAKAKQDKKEHEELIKWRTGMTKDIEYLKREVFK